MIILKPKDNKHYYKNIKTGMITPGTIYLGIYDAPNNYIIVGEEEYQNYLKEIEETNKQEI